MASFGYLYPNIVATSIPMNQGWLLLECLFFIGGDFLSQGKKIFQNRGNENFAQFFHQNAPKLCHICTTIILHKIIAHIALNFVHFDGRFSQNVYFLIVQNDGRFQNEQICTFLKNGWLCILTDN